MDQIIELAKQIGQLLRETEEFSSYEKAKEKYNTDSELQAIIGEFNLKKLALSNEIDKGDSKDDATIARLQEEARQAYMKAVEIPTMKEFFAEKEKFDSIVKNVVAVINYSITGEETQSGCSGNCSSCGGCH